MEFTVILSPEPDGGYSVSCPALPGAVSQGDSREEALVNIADAMAGWLRAGESTGETPRQETALLIADKIRQVLEFRAEEDLDNVLETTVVSVAVLVPA